MNKIGSQFLYFLFIMTCLLLFSGAIFSIIVIYVDSNIFQSFVNVIMLFTFVAPCSFFLVWCSPLKSWSSSNKMMQKIIKVSEDLKNIEKVSYGRSNLEPISTLQMTLVMLLTSAIIVGYIKTDRWLDHSEAKEISIPILSKEMYTAKRSHYKFYFVNPVHYTPPFLPEEGQDFETDLEEYNQIIPNHTMLNIKIHPGYLGWPWYEPGYRLSNF